MPNIPYFSIITFSHFIGVNHERETKASQVMVVSKKTGQGFIKTLWTLSGTVFSKVKSHVLQTEVIAFCFVQSSLAGEVETLIGVINNALIKS